MAITSYVDAVETFTRVDLDYVEDSFIWQDPAFNHATASIDIINDSGHDLRVTSFNITLRFDGAFAGADYGRWEELEIPAGETRRVQLVFQVTTGSIRGQGGTAELGVQGSMTLDFDEVEEPLRVPFAGTIGSVGWEGD